MLKTLIMLIIAFCVFYTAITGISMLVIAGMDAWKRRKAHKEVMKIKAWQLQEMNAIIKRIQTQEAVVCEKEKSK